MKAYQHDRNAEVDYLTLLLYYFGVNTNLTPQEQVQLIHARYTELKFQATLILEQLENSPIGYYDCCMKIHYILYEGILVNAGQVRQYDDFNQGNVYFGGIDRKTMQDKFSGTMPKKIKEELIHAFEILFHEHYDIKERAIRFYAEFVAVHPFYDANGRIGRYFVDIFLQKNNCFVEWILINQKHNKFLRKLNYCHSVRKKFKTQMNEIAPDSTDYQDKMNYWLSISNKYLNYLVDFWQSFVKISEEE